MKLLSAFGLALLLLLPLQLANAKVLQGESMDLQNFVDNDDNEGASGGEKRDKADKKKKANKKKNTKKKKKANKKKKKASPS
jgi:hypothetical protein